jgi:hypothetical protein
MRVVLDATLAQRKQRKTGVWAADQWDHHYTVLIPIYSNIFQIVSY